MWNIMKPMLALFGAAAASAASDVHDLKLDTFEPFIKNHSLVLAEFFAPWCGHCKALAPEYEEAAKTLKEKSIPLVKVDCTEQTELCTKYGVEGYPTLKVFRGPEDHSPYNGQRKAQSIVSYMIKQSLPAVSILDASSIDEFKKAEKVVVVAYLDSSDKSSNETYTAVANEYRDKFLFGASHDKKLAEAEGVKHPAIVLYKQFDEGKTTFTDKFESEAIEKFISTASTPLVGEVGPETYADYMAAGIPLAYIFAETPEERAEFADLLRPVAEKHRGAISIATIDAKAYGAHAGNLNLEVDKFPAFAIHETVKNLKYPFDQNKKITKEEIGKFVQDMLEGKIEPSVKSEPIPEKQEGPVHVVVAHNYKDIVLDDNVDVLLEFYAPWCGHCKALAPKYEDLASLYYNHPEYSKKVIVAKVDATANDVPDEIAGFPTIKLYPAGAKESPIEYNGARSVQDLAAFIKENGKYKVDAYHVPDEDTNIPDAESLGQQAAAASEKVKDSAASASGKAKDSASSASGKAQDAAASASGKAKDAASAASDKAGAATEKVKEGAAAATDKAASASGRAKDAAASASGKAKDAAAAAGDTAGQATEKVKDQAASATDAAGRAAEKVKDQAAAASSRAGDAKDAATGAAKDGAASASSKAGDVKEGVKDKIKSKIIEAAEAVKTAVAGDDDSDIADVKEEL